MKRKERVLSLIESTKSTGMTAQEVADTLESHIGCAQSPASIENGSTEKFFVLPFFYENLRNH